MEILKKKHLVLQVFQRCSVRKVFWEISQNSQKDNCARVYFFNKVADLACNFI